MSVAAAARTDETGAAVERRIRYGVAVSNRSGELLRGVAIEIEAPLRRTAQQEVIGLAASLPFDEVDNRTGNTHLRFRVDLAPHARRTITITAVLRYSTAPRAAALPQPSAYTRAARYLEVEHPRIRAMAAGLGGSTAMEIARAALDGVHAHVTMEGYVAEDRGALWVLDTGRGDCTESADLFVALLRARGVPARPVEGYAVDGDGVVRAGEYHGWAEFYANGTWHIADPQQRILTPPPGAYVAMQLLSELATEEQGARRRRFHADHPAVTLHVE